MLCSCSRDVPPTSAPTTASFVEMSMNSSTLRDKLEGFWVGQLVGNFLGLPFEAKYLEPMPIERFETYYDRSNANGLRVVSTSVPDALLDVDGSYTDDDTDIEFVTL